jgi:hypothetical protein
VLAVFTVFVLATIGLAVEGEVVEFVRCLHRREIYRYFP